MKKPTLKNNSVLAKVVAVTDNSLWLKGLGNSGIKNIKIDLDEPYRNNEPFLGCVIKINLKLM